MRLCGFIFVVTIWTVASAASLGGKSIDQIIMNAAPNSSMLDTFHMSPEGKVMMLVELDILMDVPQYMQLKGNPQVGRQKRKAIRSTNERWEDCKVSYEIDNRDFDTEEQNIIKEAIADWEKYTCLNFQEATPNTRNKIVFRTGTGGCYSRLGKVGGEQEIGLSRGCVHKGVVIHEIGHAIGWIHEQARPDRDNFIRVNFNRIPRDWHPQFDKFSARLINDYRITYDYRSIMHYSGNAVAPRSIETLDPMYQSVIGQRDGLSFRDVHLANVMYNCSSMLCPGTRDCRMYGPDAFMFKLNGTCRCVCPTTPSDPSPIMACGPLHTTTTPAPTTPTPRPTTTTSPVTTTTEAEPMECMDLREDCAQLAEAGECKMDMERMYMFCKKSCNFCNKGNMCMDYDPSCSLLALGGFCEREGFQELMKMKCPKSCKYCTPVDPCQMQREMGLQVLADSAHKPAFMGTTLLGLLILVWALH